MDESGEFTAFIDIVEVRCDFVSCMTALIDVETTPPPCDGKIRLNVYLSRVKCMGEVFYFRVSRSPTAPNLGPDCKIIKKNIYFTTYRLVLTIADRVMKKDKEKKSDVP